jgi:molybdate transport system substrate-binding protein
MRSSVAAGIILVGLVCGQARAQDAYPLTVFAAASLTDALQEIAADYEKAGGDAVVFNFAASSLLARQIEEGAPADVFFSADEAKMDRLEQRGLIFNGTRMSLLSNTLVIVVEKEGGAELHSPLDLAGDKVKRLALAEPSLVPAGIYARTYLEKAGLWDKVAEKIIPTGNVRGALAAVASGNAEAAIVYRTDALISKKVKVACTIPSLAGPDISYPVAVIRESRNTEAAKRFLQYLASISAGRTFERYGFAVRK